VNSIRLLTIGQAPRPDMEAELRLVLDATRSNKSELAIETLGALDGLSGAEIAACPPTSDADAFHTRLEGHRDVIVSKAAVTERLATLVDGGDDRLTIVGCTGRFAGFPRRANVLYPSHILANVVEAVLPASAHLGVLVPLAEQVAPLTEQWNTDGRTAFAVHVPPGASPDEACDVLTADGVDAVLLDCFGYETELVERVRMRTARPVLSAVRLTALVAAELLG